MENFQHIHNSHCLMIHWMLYYSSNTVYQIDQVENDFHLKANLRMNSVQLFDKQQVDVVDEEEL